jgi:putative nucleotidyltransferase with HDIG domain
MPTVLALPPSSADGMAPMTAHQGPVLLVSAQARQMVPSLVDRLAQSLAVLPLDGGPVEPVKAPALLVFADLRQPAIVEAVRRALPVQGARPALAFIVPRTCHLCHIQAASLGADAILSPDDHAAIAVWLRQWQHAEAGLTGPEPTPPILSGSDDLLRSVLAPVADDAAPDVSGIQAAVANVQADIERVGMDRWLEAVRAHHAGTYQHCLIVTGVAIRFALSLGFGRSDVERVGLAAALHDIGKAAIPLAILDKPGRLCADELARIRSHPRLGFERLAGTPGLDPDVLQAVLRHHEYLDGSGYPDGITAAGIGDLTRIITLADVYGALIERRSYKPPMPADQAFGILQAMAEEGKLEKALVGAFAGMVVGDRRRGPRGPVAASGALRAAGAAA